MSTRKREKEGKKEGRRWIERRREETKSHTVDHAIQSPFQPLFSPCLHLHSIAICTLTLTHSHSKSVHQGRGRHRASIAPVHSSLLSSLAQPASSCSRARTERQPGGSNAFTFERVYSIPTTRTNAPFMVCPTTHSIQWSIKTPFNETLGSAFYPATIVRPFQQHPVHGWLVHLSLMHERMDVQLE